MQAIDEVSSFAQSAGEYGGAPWEMLPDIGLYMDQVIMYINRQQEAVSDTLRTALCAGRSRSAIHGNILRLCL